MKERAANSESAANCAGAEKAVRRAETVCRRRALRFTKWRRRVLDVVYRSARPPTAYDVLRELGANVHPPTAYRALNFLEKQGFLHKIKSRGTYTVCDHPDRGGACYFMVCAVCQKCTEFCAQGLDDAFHAASLSGGFAMRAVTLEIEGVCAACRK